MPRQLHNLAAGHGDCHVMHVGAPAFSASVRPAGALGPQPWLARELAADYLEEGRKLRLNEGWLTAATAGRVRQAVGEADVTRKTGRSLRSLAPEEHSMQQPQEFSVSQHRLGDICVVV